MSPFIGRYTSPFMSVGMVRRKNESKKLYPRVVQRVRPEFEDLSYLGGWTDGSLTLETTHGGVDRSYEVRRKNVPQYLHPSLNFDHGGFSRFFNVDTLTIHDIVKFLPSLRHLPHQTPFVPLKLIRDFLFHPKQT